MPPNIIDLLDSGWLRVGGYAAAAALAALWGRRERVGLASRDVDWWPTYWMMSALLLVIMGASRAGGLGDLVGEFGREQARSGGWYETRRAAQAIAVVGVSLAWLAGVIVAIWRVPPRRRRYLPHVVALSTVLAFAAIRIVSLHQIDTVLYRRDIGGVRIVAITELTLLSLVMLITLAVRGFDGSPRSPDEPLIPSSGGARVRRPSPGRGGAAT